MTDFFVVAGSDHSRGKVKNFQKFDICCKFSRIFEICCKVRPCNRAFCCKVYILHLQVRLQKTMPPKTWSLRTTMHPAERVAQDLLSAWTASNLDALHAASDACYRALLLGLYGLPPAEAATSAAAARPASARRPPAAAAAAAWSAAQSGRRRCMAAAPSAKAPPPPPPPRISSPHNVGSAPQ